MKIAIEGCAHGELDKIYECILTLQEREGISIDLLICCGDFQSVRNKDDLCAMAVPQKYQQMCTFYKYYSGEKTAPILTIFIGGNHEASNYLQELPYGGWVAPKIYYLGRAGVVQFGDLRIGGLSGIFKGRDYLQGLWECPPYNQNSLRSVYHIRALDVFRLGQLKEKVHVMLSHDWPRGITEYGDREGLLRRKPFFREDIESNQLGSVPAEKLLKEMKPDYWFAAHLHCQFVALVPHEDSTETKFLALDKCLPKRRHLQILDIPVQLDGDKKLKYDAEWLAVLQKTNHLLTVKNVDTHLPGPGGNERYDFTPTSEEIQNVRNILKDIIISEDSFVQTAPVFNPNGSRGFLRDPLLNPQTTKLCELLGIDDPLQVLMARTGRSMKEPNLSAEKTADIVSPQIEPSTPAKSFKLSLPEPMTPNVDNDNSVDTTAQSDSVLTENTSEFLSDTTVNETPEPKTPVSSGKKTFKRRNQALYTPEDLDQNSVSNSSNSVLESESPVTSKLSCRTKALL